MDNNNRYYCPVHRTYHQTCNNPNHHHHHSHDGKNHKRHFHIRKTFLSKIYLGIFLLSLSLIILISILSFIFLITSINYPRIFFPGILIYIGTFICGGGIVGSYGPIDNSELKYIHMRKCASTAMFLFCLVIFPFFLYQNINFYFSIKNAKDFCLENELKSKGDVYLELIEEKEKLNSMRNNYNSILKNGLTCFEKEKCVKSLIDSDVFICNYNYEEIKQENAKCKKIFETEHYINNIEDKNVANFVSSCLELSKEKIKVDMELYKCNSYINLCKEDSINNKDENKVLEKYYNDKDKDLWKQILETDKKLKKLNNENYSYENTCLDNFIYNGILFLTIVHIFLNFGISITWTILGIYSILKNYGFVEDSEKKYYQEMREKIDKAYEDMKASKENKNEKEPEESSPLKINIQ